MRRTIESCLWTDPKVRALSPDAKLLYLYLITNPHSHLSGIYYLPKAVIVIETGLQLTDPVGGFVKNDTPSIPYRQGIEATFLALSGNDLAKYDDNHNVVMVKNMLNYQGFGPHALKAAATQVESLHNCPLIKEFLDMYPDVTGHLNKGFQIGYQEGIDTLPDTKLRQSTRTRTGTRTNNVLTGSRSGPKTSYPPEFEHTWTQYPDRSGDNPKKAAFQSWNARMKEGHPPTEMHDGVVRYAIFCKDTGKIGTEYVMQAKRFFGPDKPFLKPWRSPSAPKPTPKPSVIERATNAIKEKFHGQPHGNPDVQNPGNRNAQDVGPGTGLQPITGGSAGKDRGHV